MTSWFPNHDFVVPNHELVIFDHDFVVPDLDLVISNHDLVVPRPRLHGHPTTSS